MTIEKAIKAMEDEVHNIPVIPHGKLHSAHLLGIEAMKAWKMFREGRWMSERYDLPGETKE